MIQRLFIVTGDASGDMHAADVVNAFQAHYAQVAIEAIGGTKLQAMGIPLFYDQRRMAAHGVGVIGAIPSHVQLGWRLLNYFQSTWRPDAVLLIDYGVFNLWLAPRLKKMGIKVCYYIPPQIWASRRGRLKAIKAGVDHVFCIFPFELPLYEAAGIPATFVGHPLNAQCLPLTSRNDFCAANGLNPARPIIGLFPGSRRSEIQHLLPALLEAMPVMADASPIAPQFVLAQSDAVDPEWFGRILVAHRKAISKVDFLARRGINRDVLAYSRFIVAASGTVTLEAAFYETPAVILYRLSKLAKWLFQRYAYVQYIGLPNLLLQHAPGFLPEIIAPLIPAEAIVNAARPFLTDTLAYSNTKQNLAEIRALLTSPHRPAELVMHGIMAL